MKDINEKILYLRSYFSQNGLLLCGENKDLPSIYTVGGDWNSIISLIEEGEIFYSKLYKGRVSYLSRDLYYQIKPYKQRTKSLSDKSKEILAFIEEVDSATTKEIKSILNISSAKEFNCYMDELFKELLITAIQRDKTMNVNWSSFRWGLFSCWEQLNPHAGVIPDPEQIKKMLSAIMTDKQIESILK